MATRALPLRLFAGSIPRRVPLSRAFASLARPQTTLKPANPAVAAATARHIQQRWHSMPANRPKVYEYEDIKTLSQNPTEDRILVDVREPSEFTAGAIPTALNIPVKSQPDAYFLPAEEFEDRFGFAKPDPAKEVVFYCRAGVRSSAAASLAEKAGYKSVGEYRGSWLDWEKKGGEVTK